MEQWIRLGVIVLILLSFLRRIFKVNAQRKASPLGLARPVQGRKNDFRDIPPPPENPELG
jgi:hypothetical protein